MTPFSDLSFQTKDKPHRSIYYAKFSKYARFHEIPLQTHKDRETQICLQGTDWFCSSNKYKKQTRSLICKIKSKLL